MSTALKLTGLLVAGVLCLSIASKADDAQTAPGTHRVHKQKKTPPPPPLPSGPQGPVPQVPLDAMPAVAPQVSYADGMLSIVAPNSTLGDILRGVRKYTAADIEVPATANERVVTHLGPAPARQVMAELLNGSHFNYILLGSPENANKLVRVVLVAKTGPDNPDTTPAQGANNAPPAPAVAGGDAADADTPADEPAEDTAAEQPAPEADQSTPATPDQPGVKTPQQMLQEMQQRQLQMQQQQQQNGQTPVYPPPGGVPPAPQRQQDQ
jgi:hypothetical protein